MDIKEFIQTADLLLTEAKRQGVIAAIDALRNSKFQEMFHLDKMESEICAEALFTHINKIVDKNAEEKEF